MPHRLLEAKSYGDAPLTGQCRKLLPNRGDIDFRSRFSTLLWKRCRVMGVTAKSIRRFVLMHIANRNVAIGFHWAVMRAIYAKHGLGIPYSTYDVDSVESLAAIRFRLSNNNPCRDVWEMRSDGRRILRG